MRYQLTAVFALTLMFAGSSAASAQPSAPTTSFAELRGILRPADRLIVRTAARRRVEGRLTEMTDQSLRITVRRGFRTRVVELQEAEVDRVVRRDSPKNGALIGAAVGAAALTLFFYTDEDPSLMLFLGALGAGAGAGLGADADGWHNDTVFQRAAAPAAP